MDSFNQKVDRINAAKEAIKVSLTNKGLNPTDNIEDYAALVDSIEQGSGSGSTIKVYNSIEAMQADKANMHQNDICEIHENYEYICPLSFLGEGDEVSFNNVIIPTQFIIGKLSASALTLKYANPEGTEHLTFKKAVLNTTKLTLTYKLANQDEVSHVYTYSDTVAGYVSDLSETLILNFNSTLSLVTDASLGSVKSRINTKLNKEVLTYVYKFNNGDFEVLQGFNDTIAAVVPDIENVHLGKDGDLALALIKPNESIKPDVSYNFITFKPEINKSDITVGDYSVDIEVQVDAPAVIPSTVNRLSFIVTDATITISLQISLMGITALSYADITYTLEGDKYKLTDPQVWEVRGDISLSMIGDMKIEGLKIPNDSWNDVYSLILNGAPEFKGVYEYNNVTKSLHLAPNQFTALAKDIKQGKNVYSLDGVIEGTATDLGTLEITATKESQSLSGGFVDKIKVKAVDATVDENIQPENIKEDIEILGVKGTLGSEPTCHIFYSDEEAQQFTGYQPGDKALVYGMGEEPLNLNLSTYSPNIGINKGLGNSYSKPVIAPFKTVVLDAPMEIDTGISWSATTTKTVNYKLWITLTSSECIITLQNFIALTNSTDTYVFASTDGLTYTSLNTANSTGVTSNSPYKHTPIYSQAAKIQSLLSENPEVLNILSKFLCFPDRPVLKKIYSYEPSPAMDNETTFIVTRDSVVYMADLSNSKITADCTVLVPSKPILVSEVYDIFTELEIKEGMLYYTNTDDVYVANDHLTIVCDSNTNNKYISTYSVTTVDGLVIYKYNLKTKEKTEVTLIGDKYTRSETNFTMTCMALDGIRGAVYYNNTTDSETGEVTLSLGNIALWYVDLSTTTYTEVGSPKYIHPSINPLLKQDHLGLYGSAQNVEIGSTVFINEYIKGALEVGTIDATEEAQIIDVLDEIIGGE